MVNPQCRFHRRLSGAGVLLLLGLLVACARSAVPQPLPPAVQPATGSGAEANATGLNTPQAPTLPAFRLPWPEELAGGTVGRQASAGGQITLAGNECFDNADNAVVDNPSQQLRLAAAAQEMSWGIYAFGGVVEGDGPFGLRVELAGTLPEQYFIGIADYRRGAWQWTAIGAPTGSDYLSLPASWQPVSPDTIVYAAVVAWDGQAAVLSELVLSLNVDAPPPVGLSASDGVSGSTINLNWIDPLDSFPGLDYDYISIERALSPEGPWAEIAQTAQGVSSYEDIHDGSSNILPYNAALYYRLLTVVSGSPGPACAPDSGYRLLADVSGFTATTNLPDRIELTWDPVAGADSYRIEYCADGGGDPADWTELTLTAGEFFAHSVASPPGGFCTEKQLYNYRIQAQYLGDSSLGYAETSGLHDGPPVAQLTAIPQIGYPPLTVQWDNTSSYDSGGGGIESSGVDYDGDGSWDNGGLGLGAGDHTYTTFGSFNLTTQVTDHEGDSDQASQQVSVPGWVHSLGGPKTEYGREIAIDSLGNVVVAGYFDMDVSKMYLFVTKYNPEGLLLWAHIWNVASAYQTYIGGLLVDSSDYIYIAGHQGNTGDFDPYLLRLTPEGAIDWITTWTPSGTDGETNLIDGAALDGAGHIVLSGETNAYGTDREALFMLYDSAGNLTWSKTWLDPGATSIGYVKVRFGSSGLQRTCFAGGLQISASRQDGFMLVLDDTDIIVQRGYKFDDDILAYCNYLEVAADDSAYIAGGLQLPGMINRGLLLKTSSSGNLLWQKYWDEDPSNGFDTGTTGLCLLDGQPQLLSQTRPEADVTHLAWLSVGDGGALQAQRQWGAASGHQQSTGIATGSGGALYICGYAETASGAWSAAAGDWGDVSCTARNLAGSLTDVSGTSSAPEVTEYEWVDLVEDSGGGIYDALTIKIGPVS